MTGLGCREERYARYKRVVELSRTGLLYLLPWKPDQRSGTAANMSAKCRNTTSTLASNRTNNFESDFPLFAFRPHSEGRCTFWPCR